MNLNKPIIGVTMACAMEDHLPQIHPAYRFEFFKQQYYELIEDCDAIIFPIPNTRFVEHSEYYLENLDGLFLVGGADINPRFYDAEVSEKCGKSYSRRDNMEREMIFKAVSKKLPILAVCRGHQLINATFGGSLYQDLSEREEQTLDHQQSPEFDFSNEHLVTILPDSRLFKITGQTEITVNSAHHQILRRIPSGLRAVAYASDGVVEALEGTDDFYIQTLQWHPEVEPVDENSQAIFRDFIREARKYRGNIIINKT